MTAGGPLWGQDLATASGTDTALTDAETDEQTLIALMDRATDGDDPLAPAVMTRHGALGDVVTWAIPAGADLGGVTTTADLWLVVRFVPRPDSLGDDEVEPRVYASAEAAQADHAERSGAIRADEAEAARRG